MNRSMRSLMAAVAGAAMVVGCADNSGRVGGVDKTTVHGPHGQRLTLVKPGPVSLERGNAESITLRLQRQNFQDDVKIAITQLPQGVEAVDTPRYTKEGTVELVLQASTDADLVSKHHALVTADGPDGISASETIEITVRERS